jgi:alkylation response protein AidB-like acyl-CoA dehydrogenase
MNFELREEQVLLRDTVSRFLSDSASFEERQAIIDTYPGYSPAHWQTLAELGVTALPFTEEAGGLDGGAVDTMLIMEQMGRALLTGPYVSTILLAGKLLEQAGSGGAILENVIGGRRKMAFAYAERAAGYDIVGTALRAIRDDGDYRLDGEKCVVFHGDTANDLVVLARTSGNEDDMAGLSLFLIPSDTAGIRMKPYQTQDGNRAADISFEGVIVRASCLMGDEDSAYGVVEGVLDNAAAALVAEATGIMWAVYEMTLDYMKMRTQFGATLGSFQALQHRMVDIYMMCEMAQSMSYEAATACDSGDPVRRRQAVSAAKSLVGRYGRKVGQEGIQLHGGIGMTLKFPVGHYFKRLCMIDASLGDVAWHEARYARWEGTKPEALSTTLSNSSPA